MVTAVVIVRGNAVSGVTHRAPKCDITTTRAGITLVPTFFCYIEIALGEFYIASYKNCVKNRNIPLTRLDSNAYEALIKVKMYRFTQRVT